MYLSTDKTYGIWFNGRSETAGEWMIGLTTDLNKSKFTYGFVQSNQNTQCPSFESMNEWWDSKWSVKDQATVKCIENN